MGKGQLVFCVGSNFQTQAGISGSVLLRNLGSQHEVTREISWREMASAGLQKIKLGGGMVALLQRSPKGLFKGLLCLKSSFSNGCKSWGGGEQPAQLSRGPPGFCQIHRT